MAKQENKVIMNMKLALDQKQALQLIDSLKTAIDFKQNNPNVELSMWFHEPIAIGTKDGKIEICFNNYIISS
jgi:hypothetical protein